MIDLVLFIDFIKSGLKRSGLVLMLALMGLSSPVVADPDLLVHLELEDGQSPATDSSGNGNDGEIIGASYRTDTGDSSAMSLDFEGGDSVNLGGLDVNGIGITLAAWVRADRFTGNKLDGRIISKANGIATNRNVFSLSTLRRTLGSNEVVLRGRLRIGGRTVSFRARSGTMIPDVWYHVAMVYDESTAKLYLDGVEVFSDFLTGTIDQDSNIDVSVGSLPNGAQYWDGQIDDVYIAERAFSAAEIQLLASNGTQNTAPTITSLSTADVLENQTSAIDVESSDDSDGEGLGLTYSVTGGSDAALFVINQITGELTFISAPGFDAGGDNDYEVEVTVTDSGDLTGVQIFTISVVEENESATDLLAHLQFDDNQSPSIATDSGPLGNSGSISGAAYVFASGDGSASSLDFEGGDSVNLGGLDVNGTGITLAAWVKADSFTGNNLDGRIISKASGIATTRHVFALSTISRSQGSDDVVLRGRLRIGGRTVNFRASSGLMFPGVWYHAAMVYDESTAKLYLDGVEVFSDFLTGAIDQDSNVDVSVGAQSDGLAPWDGLIDDVYIAQRPFSAAEIQALARVVGPPTDSVIDVWYGSNQTIGNIGRPQTFANVVGHVSDPDGVASLSYSLNGGASQALTIGPDGARLNRAGDFNVDLVRTDLLEGNNLVEITAVDGQGSATSTTVNLNYSGTVSWPETYQIDWSQASGVQDAVEVVDGHWRITQDGVRTVETGYDRLLAVGDLDWDEYEVVSNFTIHSYDVNEFAGVGLLGPWRGHTDDPVVLAGRQPKTGFRPFGSATWVAYFPRGVRSRIQSGGFGTGRDTDNFDYLFEQKYNFRYRVERVASGDLQYSARVWVDGASEPSVWNVQYVDETSGLRDGSLLLIGHHTDVTFGDVSVGPLLADVPAEPRLSDVPVEPRLSDVNPDLLVHLQLDDNQSPSIAMDSGSLGNDGSISGATYVFDSGNGSVSSLDFDGGDSVDLGGVDVNGTGLTLAAWINADSFPGGARDPRIVSKASGGAANDHIFMLSTIRSGSETVLRARIRVGGNTRTLIADSGTSLSTNNWHHVAVTYDSSEIILFLDGVEVGSTTLRGNVERDSSISVAVGSQPNGSKAFDGMIDDVRILQRALTAAEINAIIGVGAPTNLVAQSISDTEIALSWTAVAGASEYRVFRDGVLIATVSDPDYIDTTVVPGVGYSYEIVAVNSAGITYAASAAAATTTTTTSDSQALNFTSTPGAWWGSSWQYRTGVFIDSNDTARENAVANISIDFDALIAQAGGTGAHDASRVRCVEVTTTGELIDEEIRCQSGDQELVLLVSGTTAASTSRYFHVYFDTASGGEDDFRAPLVTLIENVMDEGFDSLEIETNTGTLNYHTGGAGFSSLVDNDGIDWINYNPASGSDGVFRGIPNLVPPADGGYFHPGPASALTTILDTGPIRVRLESVSDDGAWSVRWDVYPDYLAFTVLEKPATDYWFLYEGTPGGVLDTGDSTVRSTGTASTLSGFDTWGGDIPGEEWVMVNASEMPRSLFVAKQNDDSAFDSYRPASLSEGLMTILGFGRNGVDAQLTNTADPIFVGLLETQNFTTAEARILSTIRALNVGFATPAVRP